MILKGFYLRVTKLKKREQVVLKEGQIEGLQERLQASSLSEADKTLLSSILEIYVWLQLAFKETKISISRLRKFFNFSSKTEKNSTLGQTPEGEENSEEPPEEGAQEEDLEASQEEKPEDTSDHAALVKETKEEVFGAEDEDEEEKPKKKVPGHGRLGHKAYTGAKEVQCSHGTFKAGDPCPDGCGGKLYKVTPKVMVSFESNALISATKYFFETVRCALCGVTFSAQPAPGLRKYSDSVGTQLAILKYNAGLPFYRLARIQKSAGVPLPASTQWGILKHLYQDLIPVYQALIGYGAQGELSYYDDSWVKILSMIKENKKNPDLKRKGMFTTAIVAIVGDHKVALYKSGRQHAGENVKDFFDKRAPGLPPPIFMSDALSLNLNPEFEDLVVRALCVDHARRKFYEIYDYFPGECKLVIDTLALVYHNDGLTKEEKMSPSDRLKYHQKQSAHLMESLKVWMQGQLNDKKIEPNSSLGKAITYMLKHWSGLTKFLHKEGAPLSNSICEQALKVHIIGRKNSLFYKTETGAEVGSLFTSLIHTCDLAGENPYDYLNCLQEHKDAVAKDPHLWFPWCYKEQVRLIQGEFMKKAA